MLNETLCNMTPRSNQCVHFCVVAVRSWYVQMAEVAAANATRWTINVGGDDILPIDGQGTSGDVRRYAQYDRCANMAGVVLRC